MNTKNLMISSCIFLGALGVALTFVPSEIASSQSVTPGPASDLPLQLLGALYLGFAMLNWMVKNSLIGGIYNRPIAVGNLMHFTVGALALIKIITISPSPPGIIVFLTTAYIIFALLFACVFVVNPPRTGNN